MDYFKFLSFGIDNFLFKLADNQGRHKFSVGQTVNFDLELLALECFKQPIFVIVPRIVSLIFSNTALCILIMGKSVNLIHSKLNHVIQFSLELLTL